MSDDTGSQAMSQDTGAVPKLFELKFPVWLCVRRDSSPGVMNDEEGRWQVAAWK
jgi:hypothetical protein